MQRPLVFIARRLAIDPAQTLGAGLEVHVHPNELLSRAELLACVHAASAIVSMLSERIDDELLDAAPRLRIVANHAVGYDNVDVPACTRRGIWVTNTPDVLTEATADLTWALLLAVARRLREGEALVRSGQFHGWTPTMLLGRELRGATLGIFGYGRIGQAVARRAEGFGMRVLFTTRTGGVELDELLRVSDILTLHAPLGPRTRHVLGPAQLLQMKRGAILINTSRGALVDEAALVRALESGHLGGAGLDVYEDEPRVHPGLLGRDDVVLLPHLGSATRQTRAQMAALALADVQRVLRGERPVHPVNSPAA